MPKATKAELRQEIEELRSIGYQMSNIFFNWSQRKGRMSIDDHDRELMIRLRLKWDAIKRAEAPDA